MVKYARKSYSRGRDDYRSNRANLAELKARKALFNALATGLSAGLTPAESIKTLIHNKSQNNTSTLQSLARELAKGKTVAEVFQRHQRTNEFDMALLQIGESSGTLDTVSKNIAQSYEQSIRHNKQFRKAIAMPVVVGLLALVLLPLPDFFAGKLEPSRYFLMLFVIFSLALCAWRFAAYSFSRVAASSSSYPAHFFIDIPVLGNLLLSYSRAHFLDRLSILYSSGYPIIEAVERSHESLVGFARRRRYKQISQDLQNGYGVADTFEHLEILSAEQLPLLITSEAAGRLDEGLRRISEDAREGLDAKIKLLVTWLPRFAYALVALGIATNLL